MSVSSISKIFLLTTAAALTIESVPAQASGGNGRKLAVREKTMLQAPLGGIKRPKIRQRKPSKPDTGNGMLAPPPY